jgi:DNA-binding transcriptional LysR family regulator
MGGDLFIRNRKSSPLTALGKDLYKQTSPLFEGLCQKFHALTPGQQDVLRPLHFYCLQEVGERLFVTLLDQFHLKNKTLPIHISFRQSNEIEAALRIGQADFGILPYVIEEENIRSYEIFREQIILVTNSSNKELKPHELLKAPFIGYRDQDPLIDLYFARLFPRKRLRPDNFPLKVNSHKSIGQLLLTHPYYAILPKLSVEKELKKGLLIQANTTVISSTLYLVERTLHVSHPQRQMLKLFLSQQLKQRLNS